MAAYMHLREEFGSASWCCTKMLLLSSFLRSECASFVLHANKLFLLRLHCDFVCRYDYRVFLTSTSCIWRRLNTRRSQSSSQPEVDDSRDVVDAL